MNRFWMTLASGLFALVVAGCDMNDDEGCAGSGDCAANEVCVDDACVPGCESDDACGDQLCINRRCVPGLIETLQTEVLPGTIDDYLTLMSQTALEDEIDARSVTVFVPSNVALDALGAECLFRLASDPSLDDLRLLLRHHHTIQSLNLSRAVLGARGDSPLGVSSFEAVTVAEVDGELIVDGRSTLDFEVSNGRGTAHIISDLALLPDALAGIPECR